MALAYIDENGLHLPTYPEVLAKRTAEFKSIFGADVYLEADSQEGQMLAMLALAEFDLYQLAQSVYNSFSPQTAQGAGLSRMVKINGIARQAESYSSVPVTCVGQAGTVITGGVAKDKAGQQWVLPSKVTIPVSGEIMVTATAKEAGAVQAAVGEVNTIATPTRGWQSVTNPRAATPGAAVESDATLRARQTVSTALPSQTVLDGIVGAVANLDGVTRFKGYENDQDEPDSNGMPGHSIAIVAEGGDTREIAQAIANKKSPGVATLGTSSATVTDKNGMPKVIRFHYSSAVAVASAVIIKPRAGYVSTTGESIRRNLADYLNALAIGEDILLSKLYTPINAAEPTDGKRTFDVVGLTIARLGDPLAAANLVIGFTELAVGAEENITVIVSEG